MKMSSRGVYKGSFTLPVLMVAISMSLSFVVAENYFSLKGQGDDRNLIVKEGVLSDIDFFLENSTSLGGQIQIVVQHEQRPNMRFHRKCLISHRNAWPFDCHIQGPCLCGNLSLGTFEYKLRMVFSQADSGRWQFAVFNDVSVDINITLKDLLSSVHAIEFLGQTISGDRDKQSFLESDSAFTGIIVISTLITVIAISSTVVIWCCPMFVVRTTSSIIIIIRRCLRKDAAIEYEDPSDIATASIIDTIASPPASRLWQTAPEPAISGPTSPALASSPPTIGSTTPEPTTSVPASLAPSTSAPPTSVTTASPPTPATSAPTTTPATSTPSSAPTTTEPTTSAPATPAQTTSTPASRAPPTSAPPTSVTTSSAPTSATSAPTPESPALTEATTKPVAISLALTTPEPTTPVPTSTAPRIAVSSPSPRPTQQPPPPPELQLGVALSANKSAPASAPKAPEPATSPENITAPALSHLTPMSSRKESEQTLAPQPLVLEATMTSRVSSRPAIPPKPKVPSPFAPGLLPHKEGIAAASPKAPTPITPPPNPRPPIHHHNLQQHLNYQDSSG